MASQREKQTVFRPKSLKNLRGPHILYCTYVADIREYLAVGV